MPEGSKNAGSPSLFEWITWTFMSPLLLLGSERTLNLEDLPPLARKNQSHTLHQRMKVGWKSELESRGLDKASVVPVLARMFWKTNVKLTLMLMLESACQVMQVLLVRWILLYIQQDEREVPITEAHGYFYACMLGAIAVIIGVVHHHIFYGGVEQGINVRAGISCMLFEKSLHLASSSMKENTQGRVLNLVTTDAFRFIEMFKFVNFFVTVPVMVIAVVLLMLWLLGPVSLLAIAILLTWTPVQVIFSRRFASVRRRAVAHTDTRIKVIGEALHAGGTMKMYSWERPTLKSCSETRAKELREISSAAVLRAVNLGMFVCSTAVSIVPTLIVMIYYEGRTVLVADVFTLIAFFNALRFPVGYVMPMTLQMTSEVGVSITRINDFLKLAECRGILRDKNATEIKANGGSTTRVLIRKESTISASLETNSQAETKPLHGTHIPLGSIGSEARLGNQELFGTQDRLGSVGSDVHFVGSEVARRKDVRVYLRNAEFTWASGANSTCFLSKINFSARKGTLTVLAGAIGSGKSSFLQALLGEMNHLRGVAWVRGRCAYVPQRPWVFSASVRDNILFGLPFQPEWYREVIDACALKPDIESFHSRDFTVVGERGVSLSGGQRARVALARAVYCRPDVLLADDPLSAVDYEVAKTIFEKCFGPECIIPKACRLLSTHHVHFADQSDQFVVLENGKITHSGIPSQLDWSDPNLAKLRIEEKKHRTTSKKKTGPRKGREGSKLAKDCSFSLSKGKEEENLMKQANARSIIAEENKDKGGVSWGAYSSIPNSTFKNSACGWVWWIFSMVLMALGQVSMTGVEYLLARWAQSSNQDDRSWVTLLTVSTLVMVVLCITRSQIMFQSVLRASKELHRKMLKGVLFSSTTWLQSQPVGRVLNRFSQDQAILDELLPFTLHDFLQAFFIFCAAVILLFLASWWLVLFLVPTTPFFLYIRRRYITSSREMKRLDGITRSPQYAHFGAALQGLSTIRAFCRVESFLSEFYTLVDANCQTTVTFEAASRWLAFRLDMIAAVFVIASPILFVALRVDPSLAGLALVYAVSMSSLFPWMVRQSAEVENLMTSVERIYEYAKLKNEDDIPAHEASQIEKKLVEKKWPQKGEISFKNVSARYDSNLPIVMKNQTFRIPPGQVVGICGRSGCGKSTLFGVIFRLLQKDCISGLYTIDGVDTSKIPLLSLRSRISIVPQEPVLFSGTLRYNLDPFHTYKDEDIKSALEKVGLGLMAKDLYQTMAEFGNNLSVGESQLLCVARALLSPSKILLIDEATAHVDAQTDNRIQQVLRNEFKSRSILIIAHRLNTIMHTDKIMVLDSGKIVEFDSPSKLLENPQGAFRKLRDKGREQGDSKDTIWEVPEHDIGQGQEERKY
ncbi:hypothetical protein AAMO2058_000647400 [Amorphochlora amoebiformis]